MARLFISYSRQDQEFVRRLYDALVADKHEVFVDWESIPPSSQWLKEINEALDKSDVVLFVISPDSLASEMCQHELAYAEANKKRLIPLIYREVLTTAVPPSLAAINWIFFRPADNFAAALATLEQAIATDLDFVKASTRFLVRAKEWEEHKRNASFLLRGGELAEAEHWLADSGGREPAPSQLQTQFIFASRRAASNRQRGLISALSVTVIIMNSLTSVALVFYRIAEMNRQEAVANQRLAVTQAKIANVRALAAQANAPTFGKNLDTRLLLSLLAVHDSQRDHVAAYDAGNSLMTLLEENGHVKRYLHTPGAHVGDGAVSVAQSQDGKVLASLSKTGFYLWDLTQQNPTPVAVSGLHSSDQNFILSMSADGTYAAGMGEYFTNDTANNDRNELLIFNTKTQQTVKMYPNLTLPENPDAVAQSMALSADGKQVIASFWQSSTNKSFVTLWPITGDPSKPTKHITINGELDDVAISPDDRWVGLSDSTNSKTFLWNLVTGAAINLTAFAPHPETTFGGGAPMGGMTFTPPGTSSDKLYFAVSGLDAQFSPHTVVWDVTTSHPTVAMQLSLAGDLAADGPSGLHVVGCEDASDPCLAERLTDIEIDNDVILDSLSLKGVGTITHIAGANNVDPVAPNSIPMVMGTDTGDIILWSDSGFSDQLGYVFSSSGNPGYLSPDGSYVTQFDNNNSLHIWRVPQQQGVPPQEITNSALTQGITLPGISQSTPKVALADDLSALALSDGNGHGQNNIILRHASGQTQTISVSATIADLTFDWSGKQLAAIICTDAAIPATCSTAEMRVWDAQTGTLIYRHTFNDALSVAFTPDDKTVLVGGINSLAFVNLAAGAVTFPQFSSKAGIIEALAVSADGTTLAAVINPSDATNGKGPYNTIQVNSPALQLWSIAAQQPLGVPIGNPVSTSLAFSADGDVNFVNASAVDTYPLGITHLQQRACTVANRNLTSSEWQLYDNSEQQVQLCPAP